MPRLSALVLDAHYADPLMADDAEVLADAAALAGSGLPGFRLRMRGDEAGLEFPGMTINPKHEEYALKGRVSEIPAPDEGQHILNITTGVRYIIKEPTTLIGRDRAEWLAVCGIVKP